MSWSILKKKRIAYTKPLVIISRPRRGFMICINAALRRQLGSSGKQRIGIPAVVDKGNLVIDLRDLGRAETGESE